jgi:hypothetical protein
MERGEVKSATSTIGSSSCDRIIIILSYRRDFLVCMISYLSGYTSGCYVLEDTRKNVSVLEIQKKRNTSNHSLLL